MSADDTPTVPAASPWGQGPPAHGPHRPPGLGTDWRRLHPLSPIVRSGRHAFALFTLLLLVLVSRGQGSDVVFDSAILGVAVVSNVVSWLVTRWKVDEGILRIETGWLRRQSRHFPLGQLQAIDVVQSGVARVLGLAELQLRMAASGAAEGRLACLTAGHAEVVRRQLLAAASRSTPPGAVPPVPVVPEGHGGPLAVPEGHGGPVAVPEGHGGPVAVPPWWSGPWAGPGAGRAPFLGPPWAAGRVVFAVRTGRLLGSIALTAYGALSLLAIGVLVALSIARVAPGVTGGALAYVAACLVGLWRRFNGDYGAVVAVTPDGLGIESGLVQTTTETIRRGSVQAVTLVEPLLWRLLGWCRLEVDVAGPRQRKENRAESGRLRAVVPVGSRHEAVRLLDELVPERPAPDRRPPRVARWKAPLSFHFLGWGGNERLVVASKGRLRRTTTWVPLDKVQSVRSVQGPWQRALGLGTVLVDTAGSHVHAALRDRTEEEVAALVATLPDLSRAARAGLGVDGRRAPVRPPHGDAPPGAAAGRRGLGAATSR